MYYTYYVFRSCPSTSSFLVVFWLHWEWTKRKFQKPQPLLPESHRETRDASYETQALSAACLCSQTDLISQGVSETSLRVFVPHTTDTQRQKSLMLNCFKRTIICKLTKWEIMFYYWIVVIILILTTIFVVYRTVSTSLDTSAKNQNFSSI